MTSLKERLYIAQFRVGFASETDFEAEKTADFLGRRMSEQLEDEDTVRVIQVSPIGEPLTQDEAILRLQLARNELLRLHYRDCMNLAQEVDKVIWKLMHRVNDDESVPNDYDWNRVIELKEALSRGENPLY